LVVVELLPVEGEADGAGTTVVFSHAVSAIAAAATIHIAFIATPWLLMPL
jgi:hypothetical protein